jgi:RHS repeat-associated protein
MGPGILTSIQYSGGLRAIREYDASLRLYQLRYETASATTTNTAAAFLYTLSPGGRVLAEDRPHEGRGDGFGRNSNREGKRIVNFYFSALNPTNGVGAQAALEGISFDSNGELLAPTNRLGTDARSFLPEVRVSNWRMSEADGLSVGYNARGSLATVPLYFRLPGATALTREVGHLTYNDGGLLQQVERGSGADRVTVTYQYDGMGRVVERQVAGPPGRCRPGIRQYFWRGQQLLEEYEWNGATNGLTRRYLYVGDELALVQSATTPGGGLSDYVPLLNLNGSVCGYARPDGTLVETILYGAYGAPVFRRHSGGVTETASSAIASTLLFQSAWHDEETGLYHFGQRTLHPYLARFLQRDPEPFVRSRALFTAFNGDPAGMVDPSGCVPEFVKNHVPAIKTLETLKADYQGLQEPLNGFTKALNASRDGADRKVTDLGMKGLGLAVAGLKLTESFGCEELTATSKQVATANTHLKTGLGILNTVADMRRDRMVLTAIKAHAMFPANHDSRLRWLAAGGATADFKTFVNSDLMQNEAVQKSRSFQAGSPGARAHLDDFQKKYTLERESKLLSVGEGTHKLASAYFNWAFKGMGKNEDVQRCKTLLAASGDLLDLAGSFNKVRKTEELAKLTFFSGEMGAVQSAKAIYGQAAILGATFDASFNLTQKAIVLSNDPLVSNAYLEDVRRFEENGGFTSVAAGLLVTIGAERAGYRLQQYAEKRIVSDAINKYLGKYMVEGRDPRAEYYSRGLQAPP